MLRRGPRSPLWRWRWSQRRLPSGNSPSLLPRIARLKRSLGVGGSLLRVNSEGGGHGAEEFDVVGMRGLLGNRRPHRARDVAGHDHARLRSEPRFTEDEFADEPLRLTR